MSHMTIYGEKKWYTLFAYEDLLLLEVNGERFNLPLIWGLTVPISSPNFVSISLTVFEKSET